MDERSEEIAVLNELKEQHEAALYLINHRLEALTEQENQRHEE
jgi:hypothetical protein